jgi:hypothetical protein
MSPNLVFDTCCNNVIVYPYPKRLLQAQPHQGNNEIDKTGGIL